MLLPEKKEILIFSLSDRLINQSPDLIKQNFYKVKHSSLDISRFMINLGLYFLILLYEPSRLIVLPQFLTKIKFSSM